MSVPVYGATGYEAIDASNLDVPAITTGAPVRTIQSKVGDSVSAADLGAAADGTTADDAALAALIAYAFSKSGHSIQNGGVTGSKMIIDGCGQEYLITQPIVIPSGSGVVIKNMRILLADTFATSGTTPAYAFVTGQGAVLDTSDTSKVKHTDLTFDNIFIDGRHVGSAGGIYLNYCYGVRIADNCTFLHCAGRAIGVDRESRTVTCHDVHIGAVYIREWTQNEPPVSGIGDGFGNAFLRTGTGIWLNSPDCQIGQAIVGGCAYPLDIDFAGNTFIGGHYYGGSIDMTHPLDDSGTIGVHSTIFSGTIFDNQNPSGIQLHNPGTGMIFSGCTFYSAIKCCATGTDDCPACGDPRTFLIVDADANGSYSIQVLGCEFRAPSVPFGKVLALGIVNGSGVTSSALTGAFRHNTFMNVPPVEWDGVYNSSSAQYSFDSGAASTSAAAAFRDNGVAKFTFEKTSGNDFRLYNFAAADNGWQVLASSNEFQVKRFRHTGTLFGVNNATPITQPTVSGSKGSNAALGSLLSALAAYGFIVDSTS